MSALVTPLCFRMHVDDLDESEYIQFISTWTRQCGRNILLAGYFNQFVPSNRNTAPANIQSLERGLEIVRNIIRSRDATHPSNQQRAMNLDILSQSLSAEIASFLTHREYLCMAQSSRRFYIHLFSTCALTELDLTKYPNLSAIPTSAFPLFRKITNLKLKLSSLHQLKLPQNNNNAAYFNHLQRLTIDADGSMEGHRMMDHPQGIQRAIKTFVECKAINTENITHLKCESFGSWDHVFDQEMLWIDIFRRFPKLECVQFDNCYLLMGSINVNELLPNLVGFAWNAGTVNVANLFIQNFASQLRSLSIAHHDGLVIPEDAVFAQLSELQLISPTKDRLESILKTAGNLRKIQMDEEWFLSEQELKAFLIRLLSECKQLEYLGVEESENDRFDVVCNGIESGLFRARHRNGGKLKLRLKFGSSLSNMPALSDILIHFARILTQLNAAKLADWMLICEFDGKVQHGEDNEKESILQQFDEILERNNAHKSLVSERVIVVTNKGCTIDGYRESWMN